MAGGSNPSPTELLRDTINWLDGKSHKLTVSGSIPDPANKDSMKVYFQQKNGKLVVTYKDLPFIPRNGDGVVVDGDVWYVISNELRLNHDDEPCIVCWLERELT